jgi:hypothetical protein
MDNRAAILTKFVNYCLGQNADRWRDGKGYLTTGELVIHWASFVGAMPLTNRSKQAKEKKTEKAEVKRKWVDICFPWNSGNCLKAVGDCKSAKGTNLRHVCNYIPDRSKPDVYCGKDHPRTSFHKKFICKNGLNFFSKGVGTASLIKHEYHNISVLCRK